MAIIFSKEISETNFLNAYNNNIVKFTSDNIPVGESISTAEILIDALPLKITPINDLLEYNFKTIISILINQNNFSDDILPTLLIGDASSHVYNDTVNTFINPIITFTITFTDDTTEQTTRTYKWLKSVEQLEQNKIGETITGGNGIYMLSPFKNKTTNTYDVTYFEGYPFDIALLLENSGITTFLNQTNALSFDFNLPNTVNRVFFSDGRTTITIDDYLPLVDGLNELKIIRGADIIFVNVTKIPSIEGQYFKFMNQYGEWNYWLFNCMHQRTRIDKDLGNIDNDFQDISDTISPFLNTGKTSKDTLTLISDSVSQENQIVLNGIFESPKIYYFTGVRFSQTTNFNWLSVKKLPNTNFITNFKVINNNYRIQIQLPQRYTMKL